MKTKTEIKAELLGTVAEIEKQVNELKPLLESEDKVDWMVAGVVIHTMVNEINLAREEWRALASMSKKTEMSKIDRISETGD